MKNISRLVIAVALVGVLVAASGVFAAPQFIGWIGTVRMYPAAFKGENEPGGGGGGGGDTGGSGGVLCDGVKSIDMGTATFLPTGDAGCKLTVTLVTDPAGLAAVPDGKAFTGDTFVVEVDPASTVVQVCYAYPTAFADKAAKLYKLDITVTPAAWVEITDAVVADGKICASVPGGGTFSLIGNP